MTPNRQVDQNAIRTNQAFTIGLLALAFVLDAPALLATVAAVMLISAIAPPLGLFTRVYRHVLRPVGVVRPDLMADNPEPYRFAQTLGGTLVMLGTLAVAGGLPLVGWGLAWVVIVLAGLNLFAGWCAGCMTYYWLNRLGVPGFEQARVEAHQ